jgi:lipopolysaccharide/colanic/teichoic acid biosynthesis glycosyltransferase
MADPIQMMKALCTDRANEIRRKVRNAIILEALARVRRAFDVAGALCLMVVSAPLMLLVGMLVAIDVGLPVTFWQQRPGAGGRPFKLYAFRTMVAETHDRHGHRLADEQRSSAIGRFLRQVRFDELPQLYNVLVGEMSFLGPRPFLGQPRPEN